MSNTIVDLEERALGAYVAIDTIEEIIIASPKETHSRQDLVDLCARIRRMITTWSE